jgi:GAF domain-containing protein
VSGEESRVLVAEQAALRRAATLVARGTRPEEVFAAVLEEVGRLLRVDLASMGRYQSDGTLIFVAAWGRAAEHFPVASRRMLGGKNLGTIVFETGRSARIDNYADICSSPIGVAAREAHRLVARDADHGRGPPLGRDRRRRVKVGSGRSP